MATADVLALAIPFVWFGAVGAVSLLETPLKFRAPGITVPLGLGIGRLVFRALNAVEGVLGVLLVAAAAAVVDDAGTDLWVLVASVWFVLVLQVAVIRPPLDRRTRRVIDGETLPPSRLHLAYIVLEGSKLVLLVLIGLTLGKAIS